MAKTEPRDPETDAGSETVVVAELDDADEGLPDNFPRISPGGGRPGPVNPGSPASHTSTSSVGLQPPCAS